MGEARGKLIHYHVFKNSGSSVDFLLNRYFGQKHVCVEGETTHDVLSSKRLDAHLREIEHYEAVSTHLGRPGPELSHHIPIAFLRDPIDRARSVYRFIRQDPVQPGHVEFANASFRDFVETILASDKGGAVIRNYQTIHFSDASFRCADIGDARATERDLRQSLALLSSWLVVGITRQFALSLRRFNSVYGALYPGLFVGAPRVNVTRERYVSDRHEWAEARLELGPALFNRLLEANALDLTLYQWAVNRLAEPEEMEWDLAMGG